MICVTIMQTRSFVFPDTYVFPKIFETLSPEELCGIFDSMAYFLENIHIHNDNIYSQITERYKCLEDRLKTQESVFGEKYAQAQNNYEAKIREHQKRCREQYDDDVRAVKQRITEGMSQQIQFFKNKLEESESVLHKERLAHTNETRIVHETYACSLREKDNTMANIMTRFDDMMNFFQSFKNSSTKGQIGENCMRAVLYQIYPQAEIIDTSQIAHAGDTVMKINDSTDMIEMKTKQNVTKEDVFKFYADVRLHEKDYDGAVFLTTSHGIPNKGEFVLELIGNIPFSS